MFWYSVRLTLVGPCSPMMGERQMTGDADFAHMENFIERKGMGKGAVGEGSCTL